MAEQDVLRPEPSAELTGAELLRWYWLKAELTALARQLRVSTAGGKRELTERLAAEVGPGFTFDAPVRAFVADGAGRTLGELIEHHAATRHRAAGEIAPPFELNRFVRAWHERHPGTRHADALAAWREHRSRPVDARRPG